MGNGLGEVRPIKAHRDRKNVDGDWKCSVSPVARSMAVRTIIVFSRHRGKYAYLLYVDRRSTLLTRHVSAFGGDCHPCTPEYQRKRGEQFSPSGSIESFVCSSSNPVELYSSTHCAYFQMSTILCTKTEAVPGGEKRLQAMFPTWCSP